MNTDVPPHDEEIPALLTSALTQRTEQVTEDDLRLSAVPQVGDMRPKTAAVIRLARSRWLRPVVTSGAVAAVAASVLVATYLGPDSTGPVRPTPSAVEPAAYVVTFTGGATEDEELTMSFDQHRATVEETAATTTYPSATVTGGSAEIEQTLEDAVTTRVTAEIDAYGSQLVELGESARPVTQTITVRSHSQWGHAVAIVLDIVNDFGGAVPSNSSTSVVIDRRTGDAIAADDLFTDVSAADATMRAAIRKATEPAPATPEALASLTMIPGQSGRTAPLNWYPVEEGLTWVVDRGAIASDAQGEPTATVPWSGLGTAIEPHLAP